MYAVSLSLSIDNVVSLNLYSQRSISKVKINEDSSRGRVWIDYRIEVDDAQDINNSPFGDIIWVETYYTHQPS